MRQRWKSSIASCRYLTARQSCVSDGCLVSVTTSARLVSTWAVLNRASALSWSRLRASLWDCSVMFKISASGAGSCAANLGCWVISYWTLDLFDGKLMSLIAMACPLMHLTVRIELAAYILVVCQVKCMRVLFKAVIISCNGAHKKAHRFCCVTSSPFFASLFLFDANCTSLAMAATMVDSTVSIHLGHSRTVMQVWVPERLTS